MDSSKACGRQRMQWYTNIKSWTGIRARELGDLAMDWVTFRHAVINALRAYNT